MNRKFVSIRSKFLKVYLGLLALVLIVVGGIVLIFIRSYFRQQQVDNLLKTREIIRAVMTESDFTSETGRSTLSTAAQAMDITIWIFTPKGNNTISAYCYGEDAAAEEERLARNMTDHTKKQVLEIMNGRVMQFTQNAFPEIFEQDTITFGYQQEYKDRFSLYGEGMEIPRTGAVVLNMSLARFKNPQMVVIGTILIAMGLVSLIAMCMILVLTNNIIQPVNEMKDAAKAIADGDFSKEIRVNNNDEIGELAEAVNSMTKDLKELENMRSGFIANISHDFRSPLTSIRGFLEAMLDGTIPEELHPKYMQVVLDETNRLTKMTNNILDLTKMENGQDELKLVHFEINEMIVKMAIGFEQRVEEKKIQMDFKFHQEKIFVNADIDKIQRVIYNLIDNALKFTDNGDSILIETGTIGQKAVISVKDTGVGIDPKSLPHIFERFNKGDSSRGNDKKGNGLGLTIVRQILVNHGEDIKVNSTLGEGTTFTFTLPLAYKINLVEKK